MNEFTEKRLVQLMEKAMIKAGLKVSLYCTIPAVLMYAKWYLNYKKETQKEEA